MNNSVTPYHFNLCERIRLHCQQQQWFGPSAEKTIDPHASEMYEPDGTWHPADWSFFDYRGYLDEQGHLQKQKITHDPRSGFEFPPATQSQIQATEEALRFPLPPLIRVLYMTLANGGFGPGHGLNGIQGGYFFGDDGHYWTLDTYGDDDPTLSYFDLQSYEQEQGNPRVLEWNQNTHRYPSHFWPICYAGCGEDFCIDAKSGRIYLAGVGTNERNETRDYIVYQSSSLEEWLEQWLQDDK
jgi:hypothetical protein